jgi:hypothetical protein
MKNPKCVVTLKTMEFNVEGMPGIIGGLFGCKTGISRIGTGL